MIYIIGGSGFIGTVLCEQLEKSSIDFQIIDKVESTLYPHKSTIANVCDIESLQRAISSNGIIINLAAEHADNVSPKSLYTQVNVDGASNVCKVAESRGIKSIIFTSSVAVYGFPTQPTAEDGEINYFNEYGRTKYLAEQVYKQWYEADKDSNRLTIIRPTAVFGANNRGNIYNLLKQIATGRFMMIGDGKNRKSMAYVENVASFIDFCLDMGGDKLQVYNYIDKPDYDMNTLVKRVRMSLHMQPKVGLRIPYWLGLLGGMCLDVVASITGKKFPISAVRVRKFCSSTVFESAMRSTGYQPPYTMDEGLDKTIRHEFID